MATRGGGVQQITFGKFNFGFDLRKGESVSDANRLRDCENALVTTGNAIEKRNGIRKIATLEPGTKGLYYGLGKLNTFHAAGDITHADERFQANKVPLFESDDETTWTASDTTGLADVLYADVFQGYLYCAPKYDNGIIRHHYLDEGNRKVKNPDYVPPVEEPEPDDPEPDDPDNPDDPPVDPGPEEPEYLDITGVTQILDPNCPHSDAVIKNSAKMFAVGVDRDVVRYSKTTDPTDWSTPDDAGFLPTGLNSRGDRSTYALGVYGRKLVALARDASQVWESDPDPTKMFLDTIVDNVGTLFPDSLATVGENLFFLSDFGFRSISTKEWTDALQGMDVGAAIDQISRPFIRDVIKPEGISPKAGFYYGTRQYLCFAGRRVFVFTYSRESNVSAWSTYTLPIEIDHMTEMAGELYLRSGDDVYVLDTDNYVDYDGTNINADGEDEGREYEVRVQLPFMNFKQPGIMKRITGIDIVKEGICEVAIMCNPNHQGKPQYTTPFVQIYANNTRSGGRIPFQCAGTEFSIVIRHKSKEYFRLDEISVYFVSQGAG